jgi:hypothetical protein
MTREAHQIPQLVVSCKAESPKELSACAMECKSRAKRKHEWRHVYSQYKWKRNCRQVRTSSRMQSGSRCMSCQVHHKREVIKDVSSLFSRRQRLWFIGSFLSSASTWAPLSNTVVSLPMQNCDRATRWQRHDPERKHLANGSFKVVLL